MLIFYPIFLTRSEPPLLGNSDHRLFYDGTNKKADDFDPVADDVGHQVGDHLPLQVCPDGGEGLQGELLDKSQGNTASVVNPDPVGSGHFF